MTYQPLINVSYCPFPVVEFFSFPSFFPSHSSHSFLPFSFTIAYTHTKYTCIRVQIGQAWHSSFLMKQKFTVSANLPPLQDILNTIWVKLIECLPLPASLRAPGYSRINSNGFGARTAGGGRIGGIGSTVGRRSSLDDENQLIDELDEDWDDEP